MLWLELLDEAQRKSFEHHCGSLAMSCWYELQYSSSKHHEKWHTLAKFDSVISALKERRDWMKRPIPKTEDITYRVVLITEVLDEGDEDECLQQQVCPSSPQATLGIWCAR